MTNATGPVLIPFEVWLNLDNARLYIGILAPSTVFVLDGHNFELLGDL